MVMGGLGEARAACARGLAQLLVFGGTVHGRSLGSPGELCAEDEATRSLLAAHRWPGRDVGVAHGMSREEIARRTVAVCELAARCQEILAERGVAALPLGGVAHVGRLHDEPGDRLVERAILLVSPYDAARARVVLAAGGLERAGNPTPHGVSFRSGELTLELRWALHPPGWSSLPMSPFFEEVGRGTPPCPRRTMGAAACWAAHRLILASTLWNPVTWSPLELAESAALGARVDETKRRRWSVGARRWGVGRVWRRADELEGWLLGGRRPDWLSKVLTPRNVGSRHPSLGECLALQDTPVRAALLLFRWTFVARRRP